MIVCRRGIVSPAEDDLLFRQYLSSFLLADELWLRIWVHGRHVPKTFLRDGSSRSESPIAVQHAIRGYWSADFWSNSIHHILTFTSGRRTLPKADAETAVAEFFEGHGS